MAAVYIHIPFCSRRCDYCDFATWVDKENLIDEYIETVIRQWEYHVSEEENEIINSIFFGGGTPNFIDARHIDRILNAITLSRVCEQTVEITVESNPDHVDAAKLRTYVNAGVNRISLGIQSTHNETLHYLGREHDRDNVYRARDMIAHAGITNVSGDLIYGSPTESNDDWRKTLDDILKLDLMHISCYALGIEQATPLGVDVARGTKKSTDDDDLADKYEIADEILTLHSYMWYEISNWARQGYESIHNRTYWHGGDVIALGCAAHGIKGEHRYATPRHIDTYLDRFSSRRNDRPVSSKNFVSHLDPTQMSRQEEKFSLRLRTREGINWPYPLSDQISTMRDEGFIEVTHRGTDPIITLSTKGRLMAHALTIALFQEYERGRGSLE